MTQLVLSDEQARQLAETHEAVELVDRQGRHLGYVASGFSPAEIAKAELRAGSSGPWYTTEEVVKHLESLERA